MRVKLCHQSIILGTSLIHLSTGEIVKNRIGIFFCSHDIGTLWYAGCGYRDRHYHRVIKKHVCIC